MIATKLTGNISEAIFFGDKNRHFTALVERYKAYLYRIIVGESLIENDPFEKDECFSYCLLDLWRHFQSYVPREDSNFLAWASQRMEWSKMRYFKKLRQYRKVFYMTDFSDWFSGGGYSYIKDEADRWLDYPVECLKKAVSLLEPEDREVVDLYLNEEDIQAWSIGRGYNARYASTKMSKIVKYLRKNHRRFFPDISLDPGMLQKRHNGRTNELDPKSKPINQFEKDGTLVKRWPSTAELRRHGFTDSHIIACCKGRKASYAGYYWGYAEKIVPYLDNEKLSSAPAWGG